MGEVLPLPARGEVFADPRGEGRTLRVSWHQDEHTLVLSLWQVGQCRATFRLPSDQVPELVRALVAGLSDGLAQHQPPATGPLGGTTVALRPPDAPPQEPATAPVSTEPPTVAVDAEQPTVPVDTEPPTVAVDPEPPKRAERSVTDTATRSAAPAAIFLAPPAEA